MADVAVEKKETPVVEKKEVAEEVDASKKEVTADAPAIEEPTTTENGDASAAGEKKHSEEAKENGDSEAAAVDKTKTDGAAAEAETPAATTEAAAEESTPAKTEENGVEESAAEANGDSTDSTPAEAVKRKVVEGEPKTDDAAEVTPEKKAKLEETSKEEVQNGAEASEVAA